MMLPDTFKLLPQKIDIGDDGLKLFLLLVIGPKHALLHLALLREHSNYLEIQPEVVQTNYNFTI